MKYKRNSTCHASPLPTRLDSSPTERASPTRRASPTPDPTHPHEPSRILFPFPEKPICYSTSRIRWRPITHQPCCTCQLLAEREGASGSGRVGSGGGSRPGSRGRRRGGPPRSAEQHARTRAGGPVGRRGPPAAAGRFAWLSGFTPREGLMFRRSKRTKSPWIFVNSHFLLLQMYDQLHGSADQILVWNIFFLPSFFWDSYVFFVEKGIFYPTYTSNRIYTAIGIGNLASQTTPSEIRSYGDLKSGSWVTTQVTVTTRLHALLG